MSEPTEKEQEEASKVIAEKTAAAAALIRECEEIARKAQVTFRFSVAYGMGGTFYPEDDEWNEEGWNPSSQSC